MTARSPYDGPPPRPAEVNYDEAKVGPYVLPDPLRYADGTPVTSAEDWFSRKRPELLEIFAREIYGRAPAASETAVTVTEVVRDPRALDGLATRIELDARVVPNALGSSRAITLRLLFWIPNGVGQAAVPSSYPTFLGLNFFGNASIHPDPSIRATEAWVPNSQELGILDHRAGDDSRGLHARRWPVEMIIARGYALATFCAGDVDPDFDDGFQNGAHGLFPTPRGPDAWASIAAWSWGLSRAREALVTVAGVDATRVAAVGHSRFGKAALWAAAQDPNFAMTIATGSGCGGASLSRRRFGELTRHLNQRFPHWFAGNFRRYDDCEADLPIDQHELIALSAPRPVYMAGGAEDLWADPLGEWLACRAADPVYELLGVSGTRGIEGGDRRHLSQELPPLGVSVGDRIGFHLRPGGHDVLAADWWRFLAFADRHWR